MTIETDITPSIDDKSTVESNNQSNDNEASLLEQALDQMVNNTKTREEAERDKELLLKGEADSTGKEEQEQEVIDDDEDENVYDPFYSSSNTIKRVKQENQSKKEEPVVVKKELDYLDVLREAGYVYVSSGEEEDKKKDEPFVHPWNLCESKKSKITKIQFQTKFAIVELDSHGLVVDKGDDDFKPSKSWKGRRPGFEFKLGLRGLGYYRTGKEVKIPSSTAY